LNTSFDNPHIQILEFWHKVEFFIPFDLRGQVLQARNAQWSVKRMTGAEMRAIAPDSCSDLWQCTRIPPGKVVRGFDLYLGVFDKSELVKVTECLIGKQELEILQIDQEERGAFEGETCFAKIALNASGEPQYDQISVSTVPWALGEISRGDLHRLNFDDFNTSLKRLQNEFWNFQARRNSANEALKSPREVLPLTRVEIEKLLQIPRNWAGWCEPDGEHATRGVIRAIVGKKETRSSKDEARVPEETDEDEDTQEPGDETGIDILNSFYIKDIERTITSLMQGQKIRALESYLTPLPAEKRINLYSSKGHQRIMADLHPGHTPSARWLDEPEHAMGLMQQFAINKIFSTLSDDGLFSINGPPGTGKTTLFRDIFAENITRRARVLASFDTARDAFHPNQKRETTFEGNDTSWKISVLKPELTGFEMVVASSNNAAVNNISVDLPKTNSLGTMTWREQDGTPRQTYLQPVATRMAAQTKSGDFTDLGPDDTPWGLISCALGNRSNRFKFTQRFFTPIIKKGQAKDAPMPKGYDPKRHQSFWEWHDQYQGKSFCEAKAAFIALDEKVQERQSQLARLAELSVELAGHDESSYICEQAQRLADAQAALEKAQAELTGINKALKMCHQQIATLKEIGQLILVPSRWIVLLGKIPSSRLWKNRFREQFFAYRNQLHENQAALRECLQEKLTLDTRQHQADTHATRAHVAVDVAQREILKQTEQWRAKSAQQHALQARFASATLPEAATDIETPHWQKKGLWYDAQLNELRSRLFAAALTLHEAWLAEVAVNGGGFAANIYAVRDLLQGGRPTVKEHAIVLWQSLFMLVPVISSTFASIASQFKGLEAGALGWLFIDEAGQAVPQAAIGALWRARRAVVVGDPLQIEPVFTVPVKLVEALAQSSALPQDMQVMPHQVSIQNLADAANPCGALVAGKGDGHTWVGSPLRVHRRCVDPMFQIANAIAYENKMIFGLNSATPPVDGYDLGPSAWVHQAGVSEGRHVVPAQIELVTRALILLYQTKGELPPLYIISPFKRIKQALLESLSDIQVWRSQKCSNLTNGELGKWCNENIGTVHTFQGKEARIVWMVLGCDAQTQNEGAIAWNILNVALTRAKHRFFIIGDARLWGGKRYFQEAKRHLPEISSDAFLRRIFSAG